MPISLIKKEMYKLVNQHYKMIKKEVYKLANQHYKKITHA